MANISQIKLPNGDTHNFIDTASGYTKNTGTITGVKTTAGAHTTIDVTSGAVTFKVPTKTSHLTNDSGFKTTDTNTTYSLSGALSSHKFTSTLTAGGSGSGTSTSELTFAAGTGITLTDDATNKKITIAASHNGTVTSVAASGSGGITISGSPITSSGTITIGLNLSTAINGLGESTSPATINDYAVVQYAGGGTTTTTYHRRKLSNLIVGKAVADQNGLRIDTGYLKLTGGNVTGPTTFGDTVSIDDLNAGQLVVSGSASFANNLQVSTINGVAVGNSPKFTDTVTTATTTGSGNAVTAITASNGALTVTKGTTFLTSHNTYTVSTTGTGNAVTAVSLSGTTFTVTKGATYSNNAGTITSVKTTAGAHTAINTTSGAVSFNVPTTAAHVGIKFGYTTSGNNRAVLQDSNGNLYVTQKDDNTTYYLQTFTTRQTDANVAWHSNNYIKYLLATSTMTSNKPTFTGNGTAKTARDGQILHLSWDNNGGWDAQIAVPDTGDMISTRGGAGKEGDVQKWTDWVSYARADHAIDNITRSGKTFTATRADGTTFTFTQQDTTYSSKAAASGGTDVSLVTTGEKYTWNSKTSNTGTITSVKTTAGAHTAINVTSGAANFNVPTTAAHVGIKFGYTTSGNNRAVLQDSSGNLYVTQKDDNSGGTVTSITLTQGAGISIGSSGTAITTSGTRTIALATSGVTAGTYGAVNESRAILGGHSTIDELGITVDKYGRVTDVKVKPLSIYAGDILCANAASSTSTSVTSTITQIPLTQTLVGRNYHSNLSLASNRIAITTAGTYRITGSIYITTTKASSVGVYIMKGSGAFSNATEIASSYIYVGIASSNSINVTKIIQKTSTTAEYIYLAGRASAGGTVASGNVATYLEVEELRF